MKRTVIAFALSVSVALPAFAEDVPVCKADDAGLICGPAGARAQLNEAMGDVSILRGAKYTPAKPKSPSDVDALVAGDRVVAGQGSGVINFAKACKVDVISNSIYTVTTKKDATCIVADEPKIDAYEAATAVGAMVATEAAVGAGTAAAGVGVAEGLGVLLGGAAVAGGAALAAGGGGGKNNPPCVSGCVVAPIPVLP